MVVARAIGVLQLGEQRLISTSATSQRAPSYSPDGATLAYAAPDATGIQQIWVQPLAAAPAIQVTTGKINANRPRWLYETNQILFALAGQGIWTVPPTGGTPTRLIERGTNPNVSRDGSRSSSKIGGCSGPPQPMDPMSVRSTGFKPPAYNLPDDAGAVT